MWNPVPVFSQAKIPVLAIFGGQDRQLDPVQGAFAYRKALSESGNPKNQVEVIPNANHIFLTSKTGCPDEIQKTMIRAFLWLAITHRATSLEQINAEIAKDPYKPGLLPPSLPIAPGYLDLIEEWLRDIQP